MNTKVKYILVIAALLYLSGCTAEADQNQKMIDTCLKLIKVSLKDPESMKTKNAVVSSKGGEYDVMMMINAKNSYGGYTGFQLNGCRFDSQRKFIKTLF